MTALVTAYCACGMHAGCPADTLTAASTLPVPGITVAAPRRVPLGTRVRITLADGRRWTLTVEDRTHRRFDGRFDIFFPDHTQAVAFGIQRAQIEILGPVSHDGVATRRAGTGPAPTQTATQPGKIRPAAVAGRGETVGRPDRQPGALNFPTGDGQRARTVGGGSPWVGRAPVTLRTPARHPAGLPASATPGLNAQRRRPTQPRRKTHRRTDAAISRCTTHRANHNRKRAENE